MGERANIQDQAWWGQVCEGTHDKTTIADWKYQLGINIQRHLLESNDEFLLLKPINVKPEVPRKPRKLDENATHKI